MKTTKELSISLRKRDKTLGEIARLLGKPKTTIYFHIKNVPLSLSKKEAVRALSKRRMGELAKGRRGKSNRKFDMFSCWSEPTVRLVAHLLFDGSFGKSSCGYYNRSFFLSERFKNDMCVLYKHEPATYQRESGVIRVEYYNVALKNYLKEKSIDLQNDIFNLEMDLKIIFLRAFFDDEGCVDFNLGTKTRRVRGYQKNISVLGVVQDLLAEFEIKSAIQEKYCEITVTGKENLLKFREVINFSGGVFMNGSRKNSRWGKDLEKRKILDMMIDSYLSLSS